MGDFLSTCNSRQCKRQKRRCRSLCWINSLLQESGGRSNCGSGEQWSRGSRCTEPQSRCFHLRPNETTSNDALKPKRQAKCETTTERTGANRRNGCPGTSKEGQQATMRQFKSKSKPKPKPKTPDPDEVRPFWANPPRRNRVVPTSGHSVTYRNALMSRGGRLAFPVRGSRFRSPLRYLGHSSSNHQNQDGNQVCFDVMLAEQEK